ncbi:Uncharacterised protein [Chlamydia trachomatis]|nr:Uncharacterised protein [Chlamydia trachomatis]CRH92044.1 Uncharacterised protein [Chlamydia trachomatis]
MDGNDDHQGGECVGEAAQSECASILALCRVGAPRHDVASGDGDERDTHDGQKCAGDDGWEEAKEFREERCHEESDEAGRNDGAIHGGKASLWIGIGWSGCDTDCDKG